jgi:hypothetical protein
MEEDRDPVRITEVCIGLDVIRYEGGMNDSLARTGRTRE